MGHTRWVHLNRLPLCLQDSFDSVCAIWVSICCYNLNDFPGWHNKKPNGNSAKATWNTDDSYPTILEPNFPFLRAKSIFPPSSSGALGGFSHPEDPQEIHDTERSETMEYKLAPQLEKNKSQSLLSLLTVAKDVMWWQEAKALISSQDETLSVAERP